MPLSPALRRQLKKIISRSSHFTLLLDFDGTLSPIVRRPHLAKISPPLKKAIRALSKNASWKIGIVSGRDLKTVRKKVNLPNLIYAGNHGYEIKIPGRGLHLHPAARKTKPLIHKLCQQLKRELKSIRGALIENKVYSASLHTRTLNAAMEKKAVAIFNRVTRSTSKKKQIRITKGKKVWEIRPPAQWDKGKAVLFVLKKIKKSGFPIYVGDDRTDEDAFRALKQKGLTLRVGKTRNTRAHFCVPSVGSMRSVFQFLTTQKHAR